MPLKLKIGLPDYGSKGASVNLELELDTSLVNSPDRLQDHIKALFEQARIAVEAELFGREASPGHAQNGSSANSSRNGHHRQNGRPATDSQVRALHAIANRQKLDLSALLERQYRVSRPEDLSLQQASQLIDERQLLRLRGQLGKLNLLILDELGYVPASKAGAEHLFDVIATAYERHSVLVTTILPFEHWTEVLGSERLTGAALDRLTHHCHILETTGESYQNREIAEQLGISVTSVECKLRVIREVWEKEFGESD